MKRKRTEDEKRAGAKKEALWKEERVKQSCVELECRRSGEVATRG
jgi:hypothetical protein